MKAKDIIMPTLTLVMIALVVTALLVLTNGATKDMIARLQAESDEQAKQEVLSEADGFTDQTITVDGEEFIYFEATNGAGYVFSTSNPGYGGAVVVMTGISADGEIKGVKVTSHDETPGLGAKADDESFTEQYKMPVPADGVEVTKTGKTADNEIDAIAGATITSTSVTNSVNDAVALYELITGGAN